MFSKTNKILFALSNLAFIGLYLMLGYFNRLVPEDYIFLIDLEKKSLLDIAVEISNSWGGRLLPDFFAGVIIWLNFKGLNLIWFHLLSLILLAFPIYSIFNHFTRKHSLRLSTVDVLNIALLFVSVFFCLTISVGEGWYWVLSSTVYLWSIVMALIGWSIVIRKKSGIINSIILFLVFFYVGDASEPFALMNLLVLLTCILLNYRKQLPFNRLLLLALFGCLTGFLFMYLAPGTGIRKDAMPQINLLLAAKRDIAGIVKLYTNYFSQKVFYVLVFGATFLLIGNVISLKINSLSTHRSYSIAFIVFNILLFIAFFPVCYIMGEAGPLRSWNHIMFYFTALLFLGGVLYSKPLVFENYKNVLLNGFLTLILCTFIYLSITQFPLVSKYANKVDERNTYVLNLKQKKNTKPIFVNALPLSGLLYQQELGTDSVGAKNSFYCKGLGLDFGVVSRK